MGKRARLIFAASDYSADMLYAVGLFVPDPFLWAEVDGRSLAIMSPLEFGRACTGMRPGTEVVSYSEARKRYRLTNLRPETLIAGISRIHKIKVWDVPRDFPLALAEACRRRGIRMRPVSSMFFPERACKNDQEVAAITKAQRIAETGLSAAIEVLRRSTIRSGKVIYRRHQLTSEKLRSEIEVAIVRAGGTSDQCIAAPGVQGADPHNSGSGPVAANEPIIIDIFPRCGDTGYYGDLTRTLVKGEAAPVVKKAFRAVKRARDEARKMIKPGVKGSTVHRRVTSILKDAGFITDINGKPPFGFIHGTGHGLGLEIHEAPRLSMGDSRLKSGHVVTVEPGVYYPEWGGVRLEDLVLVEKGGCRLLTEASTFLEIP